MEKTVEQTKIRHKATPIHTRARMQAGRQRDRGGGDCDGCVIASVLFLIAVQTIQIELWFKLPPSKYVIA